MRDASPKCEVSAGSLRADSDSRALVAPRRLGPVSSKYEQHYATNHGRGVHAVPLPIVNPELGVDNRRLYRAMQAMILGDPLKFEAALDSVTAFEAELNRSQT